MALEPLPATREPGDEALEISEPLCAVFRRALKGAGLKYTPERAQVLDAIIRFGGLFQADELLAAVRAKGYRVSKATVYRTIQLLQEAGIIQRVLFDDERAHFQLVYGRRPNDLLIRVDTHEVISIDVPELIALRDRICRERGLEPEGHRLQIFAVGKGGRRAAGQRR
jgi:Fur family transcriptional regulator, ferric uptake regulator